MTPNEINIEKFFLILKQRINLIGGMFAAAVCIAVVVTIITPKMYTATVSLNFEFNGANPFLDSRSRTVFAEDTYITTQIGIIQSQNVAQEVVNSLTEYERKRLIKALDENYSVIHKMQYKVKRGFKDLFKSDVTPTANPGGSGLDGQERPVLDVSDAYSVLAQAIGRGLRVEPVFNSRIVEVSYLSSDPQISALMANKFAEAYIATNLEMMIDPARKTKVWFDDQLKSLRKTLEDAQAKLTAYQQQEGIVFSDERLDTEKSRLQKLSAQLVAAQDATRNAATEKQKLQEVLDRGESLTTFPAIFNNPVVQNIKAEIRRLEAKRVELSGRLGANHPKYRQARSDIAAARKRLAREIDVVIDGVDNAAALAKERENDLEAAIAKQKQLVLDLKIEHDQIAVLSREVESAQATYNAALSQLNTTSMRSMIDQTNVSVVDPANVPGRPSSPSWKKNLMLGVLGGLLLGVGFAVLLEIFGRRLHSRDDLLEQIGIPVLGHLKKA